MFEEIHIFLLGTKKSGSRFSTNLFEPCARNVLCLDKRENGNVMNSKRKGLLRLKMIDIS